ncbi:MAG: HAMP domain-containing sensor histidine kinase [Deltaproteobacteria bacterium]
MALSIRKKLTIWYVALLLVSLLASSAAFSYYLYRTFLTGIDGQINSVAGRMIHTIVGPSGQLLIPGDFDIILERFFGIRTSGNYIQMLDPLGKVVAKSSNLSGSTLPLSRQAYESAFNGSSTFEIVMVSGKSVRLVTKPIVFTEHGIVAIVQVAASLDIMQQVFHSMAYIFTAGFVGSAVMAGLLGYFLAKKALQPVAEITKTARRIGAENLNERINVAATKDEIGMLASTINEMIERLERSFRQIKQFTADASHELKTPLTILKGEMEVALRSGSDPQAMKEAMTSALEEIDRMNYLVKNLLDLARIDAEKEAAGASPVRLDTALLDRAERLRRFASEKGVGIAVSRNDPAEVMGDPVRIGQLIFNLIDNAVKYTPQGHGVFLSVENNGGSAILKVRDTGMGISKDDLPYIFDRFYRVDKARTRDAGGAGLGLSICREIVESMKGAIEAESEVGRGTTFTVRLPLAGKEKEADKAFSG